MMVEYFLVIVLTFVEPMPSDEKEIRVGPFSDLQHCETVALSRRDWNKILPSKYFGRPFKFDATCQMEVKL